MIKGGYELKGIRFWLWRISHQIECRYWNWKLKREMAFPGLAIRYKHLWDVWAAQREQYLERHKKDRLPEPMKDFRFWLYLRKVSSI